MMQQPILDMRAIAAQDADDRSPGWLDTLLAGLLSLPEASDVDAAIAVGERADAYADSQPSFAADLRAAIANEDVAAGI